MLPLLENRLNQQAFSRRGHIHETQHLAKNAAGRSIYTTIQLFVRSLLHCFGVDESGLDVVAHDQISETAKGFAAEFA